MSRTSNQTLPNVMLEKGMFDDLKVLNLLETYGCVGFTVWVSLLFKIADDKGYYTQMSPSLITAIQKDIGNKWVNRDKIIGVINGMLECELLDSSLFRQGVLTSVGIQRRYLDVKRKSRAKGFSTEKYWLLDENSVDSPIEYNDDEIEHNNADKCNNNADKCNNNTPIKITGTGSIKERKKETNLKRAREGTETTHSEWNGKLICNEGGQLEKLLSHEEILWEYGAPEATIDVYKEFLKHCYVNGHLKTNDALASLVIKLNQAYPDDVRKQRAALKKAINGGYYDVVIT